MSLHLKYNISLNNVFRSFIIFEKRPRKAISCTEAKFGQLVAMSETVQQIGPNPLNPHTSPENVVDQGLPKRASFFFSSSISSVMGTAPSDIFSALWMELQINKHFQQNENEHLSPVQFVSLRGNSALEPVVKTTIQNNAPASTALND